MGWRIRVIMSKEIITTRRKVSLAFAMLSKKSIRKILTPDVLARRWRK